MKQLEELHLLIEQNEANYLIQFNELKRQNRDQEIDCQEEHKKINAEYARNIERLTSQLDEMRMELETEIKQLTAGMEDQRDTMELKNNELEITLEKCNQKII